MRAARWGVADEGVGGKRVGAPSGTRRVPALKFRPREERGAGLGNDRRAQIRGRSARMGRVNPDEGGAMANWGGLRPTSSRTRWRRW